MFSLETCYASHKRARQVRAAGTQGRAGRTAPHASRSGRMREPTGSAAGMAEQRREQMLRAALEVIIERGYPDTRVTDVAERAGTSPRLSSTTSRPGTNC